MTMSFIEAKNLVDSLKEEIKNQDRGNTLPTSSLVATTDLTMVDVPTPYGTVTGTHPSVRYFPNKFSRYSHWMAFTPYPETSRENPCILASNDGKTWVEPAGLTNPIDPTPPTGYNSDTELVYGPGNKLYCYWRWHKADGEGGDNILYRMESTNGTDWTDKTACTFPEYADPLSPSVTVGTKNDWKLWLGASVGQSMRFYTSSDGINWSEPTTCVSNIEEGGFHWHPMVWREPQYYYCLSSVGSSADLRQAVLMNDLYFGYSKDGINWTFDANPFLTRGQFDLNHYRVYRSSAIRTSGDELTIYVSGLGRQNERISMIKAKLIPPTV